MSSLPNRRAERREFQLRLSIAGLLVLLLCTLLGMRLYALQVSQHQNFTTQSENNRIQLRAIAAGRGRIFDRNGTLLATNQPSFTLTLVADSDAEISRMVSTIGQLITLSGNDIKRFNKLRRRLSRYTPVALKFGLTEQELATLAAHQTQLPGMQISPDTLRYYPEGAATAHIVGYTGKISAADLNRIDRARYRGFTHIGKVGIERQYETELRGEHGYEQIETNASGRALRTFIAEPSTAGDDIYLTIDVELQKAAMAALGGQAGSIVALEPDSGEVLAMVSAPSYDPNLFITGNRTPEYRALGKNPLRPLFHRSVQGQYPPGSTVKPLLAMAGLEYGVVTRWQQYFCPGYKQLSANSRKYRDWKRGGHKETDMTKAIIESCDVYFYELALELGIDNMHDFLANFGLGDVTGIDLVGEKPGLLPSKIWKEAIYNEPWYRGETLNAGIGQGFFLTTPLQLAVATATVANRGERMQPRLLLATSNPESGDRQLGQQLPQAQLTLTDPSNWQHIIQAMTMVLQSDTGSARRIADGMAYSAAGKTGTSQVFGLDQNSEYGEVPEEKRLRDHALFIAFAPVEAPRIALAVVVENGGGGGRVAAPIAREVMDAWLLRNNQIAPPTANISNESAAHDDHAGAHFYAH